MKNNFNEDKIKAIINESLKWFLNKKYSLFYPIFAIKIDENKDAVFENCCFSLYECFLVLKMALIDFLVIFLIFMIFYIDM